MFVAFAGNYSHSLDDYIFPCTFNNVICVGATDNIGINDDFNKREEFIYSIKMIKIMTKNNGN